MTTAKSVSVVVLVNSLMLVGSLAPAQGIRGIPFAQIDINGDGSLDAAELISAFDAAGLSILSSDLSGDGLVTREELRASRQHTKEDGVAADGSDASHDNRSERNSVNNLATSSDVGQGTATFPNADNGNHGRGNDVDDSNPGRGAGNSSGNGNGKSGGRSHRNDGPN